MKIYLFRNQTDVFKITKKKEAQVERFIWFGALIYTKHWVTAPRATEAPSCDLQL